MVIWYQKKRQRNKQGPKKRQREGNMMEKVFSVAILVFQTSFTVRNGSLCHVFSRRLQVWVTCGNHFAPECSACGGKNWCNGECEWDNQTGTCIGVLVSCGNHLAPECSACGGKNLCKGECEWEDQIGTCASVLVSCGNHLASRCIACGGKNWCNGECEGDDQKGNLRPFTGIMWKSLSS